MSLLRTCNGFAFALITIATVLVNIQSEINAETTRSGELVISLPKHHHQQQVSLPITEWSTFTTTYNKHYPTLSQMLARQSLFMTRLCEVFITTFKHYMKLLSYHTTINKYSDATRSEIERLTSGDSTKFGERDFTDDDTIDRILAIEQQQQQQPYRSGYLKRRKRELGNDDDDDDDDIWSSKIEEETEKIPLVAAGSSQETQQKQRSKLASGIVGILKPLKAVNRVQSIVLDWLKPNNKEQGGEQEIGAKEVIVHKDWRETGCIGWPRDQGYCESCYAFSSTAFAEWAYCQHQEGKFTRLSPQYLINCASRFNPQFAGCSRGPIRLVPDFFKEYGLELEDNIPYVEETNECHIDESTPRDSWGAIKPIVEPTIRMRNNTDKLDKAIGLRPVILSMFTPRNFIAYGGGFIDDCDPGMGGHAVLLVGSMTEDGTDYLLAQNSLGAFWGLEGYFKIKRTPQFLHKCVKHFMVPSLKFAD